MISGIDYGKGNDESCTVTFVSPEYIKNLEEENQQLKADYGTIAQVERDFYKSVIAELRSWLEKWLKVASIDNCFCLEEVLDKLNELEGNNE